MNLDELKTAWKVYERRLEAAQEINEKIIVSMITDRSLSRFERVRRKYVLGFAWLFICLAAGIAVIATNPFDFNYRIQYVPMVMFCSGVLILMAGMVKPFLELRNLSITQLTVDAALRKIIQVYERPRTFFMYVIVLFLFSQIVLFPLSMLPKNIGPAGLWPAVAERLIPISISALILFAAYKLGAFRDRDASSFRKDLDELQALKRMSAELHAGLPENHNG